MRKINTSPISGMQELLPAMQAEFNRLKAGILEAYLGHGFLEIETPTIERSEILFAKAGGDTEKQIYKVIKTAEDASDADQALRFDHTVPLARYVAEHNNDLTFPFKVTQIGRNFRGERPQRGRFREFYQCDIDVIGRNELAIGYDAEVITTLADAMVILPLPSFLVRVSNRKILTGLLEALNLEQHTTKILGIIDHAEKVPEEKTIEALEELGLGSDNVVKITTFMKLQGKGVEVVAKLREFGFENETFRAGVDELEKVFETLADLAPELNVVADMLIVRGLDYYTGTVFETIVPEHREIGSICSGGRYENLASNYTEQKFPGVGGSIGLTRLFYILQNYQLVSASQKKPVDICIIPFSERELKVASELARKLRTNGETVDIVLSDQKLGTKLKYVAKVAKYAIVLGEEEVKTGEYRLRDFETGQEEVRAL